MTGKVYLVGAGPGEGGLMTLRGAELIKKADIIVYDRLVGQDVMNMIPDGMEMIDVGKNAGTHPVPQWRINEILVEEAKKGKNVVRLKGGDPFVFGRGGEELELISENGIEFEVVPGITSSIAVPAFGGIPVTHRDFCSSLHIITGHARAGAEVKIDFDALVRLKGTLIFMMSVSNLGMIAKGLRDAGMEAEMPCAIIENGTRTNQRKFVGTLGNIENIVRGNNVRPPSVILVGKVASLSDTFDWFSKRSLMGKKYLVTQPAKKSSRLAKGLKEAGADVTLYPCIKTTPLEDIEPPISDYDVVVFTSTEGVDAYIKHLMEKGKDARTLAGKRIACIGSATNDALAHFGLIADFIPSVFSGEVLGREMVEKGFVTKENKVLLLRALEGSLDVPNALEKAGIDYLDYPVYKTELIKHDEISDIEKYDMVCFTSKSCVRGFAESQKKDNFNGIGALCIGEQTAKAAEEVGFSVTKSNVATIAAMIEKAKEL